MDTPSTPQVATPGNKGSLLKTPAKIQKLQALSVEELLERHEGLVDRDAKLTEELAVWSAKGVSLDLSAEMRALHKYNETKDFAQVVLGYLLSVDDESTIKDLHVKYNLPTD